jgi:transcriptional regulator with XRE-family HTH domain
VVIDDSALRLREERERLGFSQKAFGQLAGVSKNTQLAYESGASSIPLSYLSKLEGSGLDIGFVATGHRGTKSAAGEIRLDYRPQEPAPVFGQPFPDSVPVREIDLSFGMGATYLDVPITEEVHHFPRAWLRRYTRSAPDKLFFAQGIGDSMEPTLHDSDLLLIDTDQRQLVSADRIWVLTYADCGMIKRLRPVPGGGVEVWSDKKEVSPFTAYDGEIEIIGRVVAVQRKL